MFQASNLPQIVTAMCVCFLSSTKLSKLVSFKCYRRSIHRMNLVKNRSSFELMYYSPYFSSLKLLSKITDDNSCSSSSQNCTNFQTWAIIWLGSSLHWCAKVCIYSFNVCLPSFSFCSQKVHKVATKPKGRETCSMLFQLYASYH